MSTDGPVVYHPIPRRPFIVSAPTPPEDAERENQDQAGDKRPIQPLDAATPDSPQFGSGESTARFLNTRPRNRAPCDAPGAADSLSRVQSIRNLTSSTLFGIFSSDGGNGGSHSGAASDLASPSSGLFEPGTPWGTGAETPARELFARGDGESQLGDNEDGGIDISAGQLDEVRKASMSLLMLQRKRRRGESFGADGVSGTKLPPPALSTKTSNATAAATATATNDTQAPIRSSSRAAIAVSVLFRAAVLFALGMGYGGLVSRLRSQTHAVFDDFASPPEPPGAMDAGKDVYDATHDWRYLVSWGASGVMLGTLLPWFDGVWDRTFARSSIGGRSVSKVRTAPETDWALMVRGIGAFAGVVFAIRKLPWASTMQASLTLALANPFLWYLLDRSKSGLLLSAAVGFVGSAALVACNLDLMPSTTGRLDGGRYHMGAADSGVGSFSNSSSSETTASAGGSGGGGSGSSFQSTATVETAVWMLSVLFCSCICFGNIGRRLALPAAARGQ